MTTGKSHEIHRTYDVPAHLSALLAMIQIEEITRDMYLDLSRRLEEKNGRTIMADLSRDEQEHMNEIATHIVRLAGREDISKITPMAEILGPIISEKKNEGSLSASGSQKYDEISAIEHMSKMECLTIDAMMGLVDRTNDDILRTSMERMIDRNIQHRRILEDNLEYLRKGKTLYGYVPISPFTE